MSAGQEVMSATGFKLRGLRWWIISLIFLATVINYIDRQTINVLAPVLLADLKLSKVDFGHITSAFLLAYMVGMGLWGRIVDRIGTRMSFAIAITIWSVAACLHSLVAGFLSLLLLRAALALGEAGNWPGAAKGVAEWFPGRERALGMAIFNSGAAVGAIVATPILVFMQLSYGWKQTFLLTGALGFIWLSGVSLNRARKICMLVGAALMPAGVLAARVESPAVAIALVTVVLFAFQIWMNNVQALPGDFFPKSTVGAVFGLGGVAAGAGSFTFMMTSGWLVENFSYEPMFLVAGLLGPLGALALFILAGPIRRLKLTEKVNP